MRFGILGETRASRPDGGAAALGGPGRRALLAMLLLEAGRVVPVERLIDGLYGEEPPAGAGNALQSQVSRLRSAVGVTIDCLPGGYRLVVRADEVDAHRFEALAVSGRAALAAGAASRAAAELGDALRLWRGPALADVGQAPFARVQATRLEELRIGVVEDRVEAELQLGGRHRDLVGELRELVAVHPLRERPRAQLMRALHGSGRQAEALREYEEVRRELAESLGADPGPELAAAHLAVLRGEPVSAAGVSRETPPPTADAAADVSRETLTGRQLPPAQLTSFVGRAAELARIGKQLDEGRLVTLLGPGGSGKTRLSVEAAERHGGAVCFADLSGLVDGAEVPQALLAALGLRQSAGLVAGGGHAAGGSAPGGGRAVEAVTRLTAALADRPLLLVLDNCEHVVEAAAALTARLLAACPLLRVLATSREALGITGESLCLVPPLPLPPSDGPVERAPEYPAVRLFADRAAAVRPGFDLSVDLDAVVRICAALDGLPLAIELAAARLRSLTAGGIAGRLASDEAVGDQRFRLLSRGDRTAAARQQTLRGVVAWSWDLLDEAERAVLRRASVFAGGWTLEAAEAVCADGELITPEDVLDVLEALVDKSLVVTDGIRHRMLETIRAYAAERLSEAGETEALRRAHAAYFLDLAVTAEPCLRRAEQLEWLRRLSADHDNLHTALRRAVESGDTDTGMRLLAALSTYWALKGVRYEGERPARRMLAAIGPCPPEGLEQEYLLCVLAVAAVTTRQEELAAHLATASRLLDELNYLPDRYPVISLLWAPLSGTPDPETWDRYRELVDVAHLPADPWYRALASVGGGFQHWMVAAEFDTAAREFTIALEAFRELGDRWGTIVTLTQLAWLAASRGESGPAIAMVDEALVVAEQLGATENIAELLSERGRCALIAGEPEAARADFRRSLDLARRTGVRELLAGVHLGLAESARALGDLDQARADCELSLSEAMSGWYTGESTRVLTLISLARIAEAEGDPRLARAHYRQAIDVGHGHRDPTLGDRLAEALAALALLDGTPERTAALLGLAAALSRRAVPPSPDAVRTEAAARAALGGPGYETAHARYASLSITEARQVLRTLIAASADRTGGRPS